MKNLIVRFVKDDQGQDLIEYALLASFLSVAAAAGATLAGTSLNTWYTNVSTKVDQMAAAVLAAG
jgi:pilus assembly protein Flp/PilA